MLRPVSRTGQVLLGQLNLIGRSACLTPPAQAVRASSTTSTPLRASPAASIRLNNIKVSAVFCPPTRFGVAGFSTAQATATRQPAKPARRPTDQDPTDSSEDAPEVVVIPGDPHSIKLAPVAGSLADSFAVVHVGGTQVKVTAGDVILTQKLLAPVGSEIVLDKVLLVGTTAFTAIGRPLLESAKVHALVEEQTKTHKIIIFKFKRRNNYRRTKGHRQEVTSLRIRGIVYAPPSPAASV
eukprot:TRINITY_DN4780_c0_g1_i1.p1 TRINITY_DN4780_c0_g1~~TRINITY_DN4780_c0_g1_i1.p1  ORF type:complete len:239 (-),score=24.85 TRINITY_DN4780_c0_g1_i1:102-818(-)